MAIYQGNDGYLTFSIQANKENQDMFLISFKDFLSLQNEEDLAYSLINRNGLVTSMDAQGSFVEKSDGKFAVIAGNEFNPIIYRGQNKDYDFVPTSERYELASGDERIRHAIDWIKKHEFLNLFKTSHYSSRMEEFSVLNCKFEFDTEAISSNYGFMSNCIDFTRNLMTAYFFAYTTIDEKSGRFMPIQDFETYSPTLYIGNLPKIYNANPELLKFAGSQLLLRSKIQQTLSINFIKNMDIKSLFKKIDLPKNPAVAINIFKQTQGGAILFPGDYVAKCGAQIKNYKTLQENLIAQYCAETGTDHKWLIGEIKKLGWEIVDKPWNLPEQGRYIINREIDELIIPYLNTNIIFRGCKKNNPENSKTDKITDTDSLTEEKKSKKSGKKEKINA